MDLIRSVDVVKPVSRQHRSPSIDTQKLAIAIGVGLLGLGTYLWQLTVPIYLQLYDSGVYMAASIHFVSGVMPYRDFAFVQPPGILLLLSPIAALSRVIGSHDGFVVARVVSALATALDASLLSWLVRHHGRVTMALAGTGLALVPVAVFFSSGVRLEPFCLLFVLLGSLTTLGWRSPPSSPKLRPLLIGGLLFGIAGVVEFWAFFPFLAMLICLLPKYRRRAFAFVAGAAGGVLVPSLPFLLLAPRNFVSELFIEQLRHPRGGGGLSHRLIDLTGLSATSVAPTGGEAMAAFAVLLLLAVAAFKKRTKDESVDSFVLLAAVFSVCGLLAAPVAYRDYGYFAVPFLIGLVSVTLARLIDPARRVTDRLRLSVVIRRVVSGVSGATALVLIVGLILFVTTFYSVDESLAGVHSQAISRIRNVIPAGSCVVYEEVGLGLLANRFQSTIPHCPSVVDPYGASMAWGYEQSAPAPVFVAMWKSYLRVAQFVVVDRPLVDSPAALREVPYQGLIAWNQSLLRWFDDHFHLLGCRYECIYKRE